MSRFLTARQLAEQATFLNRDYQQVNRMRFNKLVADFVFPDLQIDVVKEPKREFLYINKRTNSIDKPCDSVAISSVSWVDCWGIIHPVYRNETLHNDIIDLGAKKDCACTCNHNLCNMIKGYESVITYVDAEMPDETITTFTCVSRKWYAPDGTYFSQTQAPQRTYEDGEWTDTVLATTNVELCKLEVDANGCATDCENNYRLVTSCGCNFYNFQNCPVYVPPILDNYTLAQNYAIECGAWFARPCAFNNIYNINDEGNRLIFPHDFGFDRVLIRYYRNVPQQEMKIPFVLGFAATCGIMYYDIAFDQTKNPNMINFWERKYIDAKFGGLQELNKYNQAELFQMLNPPAYIPS